MEEAYLIDGGRTVFGKVGGALAGIRPDDLSAVVMSTLVGRNPAIDPELIDDVFWGSTNQAGDDSRNVARIAAVLAGLPHRVPGTTVNRLCGSGLEAVAAGARAIRSGEIDICLSGGAESMSRAPFVLPRAEKAYQRQQPVWDSRLGWRSVNPRWREQYGAKTLGECAELTAAKYGISRDRQDEYSLASHQKAAAAWEQGNFAPEIVDIPSSFGDIPLTRDESVRPNVTATALANLKPVFIEDGLVTAGNSSPMSDGAAGVILASGKACDKYSLTPMARVVGVRAVGVHPDALDGPIPATRELLTRTGWAVDSVDQVEMNEAFASQCVACIDELKLDIEQVNKQGGAIAMGHPLGASGTRLVISLMHQLKRSGGQRGVATLCIGIGQGQSMALEAI